MDWQNELEELPNNLPRERRLSSDSNNSNNSVKNINKNNDKNTSVKNRNIAINPTKRIAEVIIPIIRKGKIGGRNIKTPSDSIISPTPIALTNHINLTQFEIDSPTQISPINNNNQTISLRSEPMESPKIFYSGITLGTIKNEDGSMVIEANIPKEELIIADTIISFIRKIIDSDCNINISNNSEKQLKTSENCTGDNMPPISKKEAKKHKQLYDELLITHLNIKNTLSQLCYTLTKENNPIIHNIKEWADKKGCWPLLYVPCPQSHRQRCTVKRWCYRHNNLEKPKI